MKQNSTELPTVVKLKYPINRYSTKYLLDVYERTCISLAIWHNSLNDWDRNQPAFKYCRMQADKCDSLLATVSTILVVKREVDLDYLITKELRAYEDVQS